MEEKESSSTTIKYPGSDVSAKREPGRYLVPIKYELNGSTGYVTWHCRVEEVDTNGNVMHGPVQLYGVDTPHLNRHHDGKHINFLLNHVKPRMMKHFEDHTHDHSDALGLEGQSL